VKLPAPESEELSGLISNAVSRAVYKALYENRGNPLSIHEIRDRIGPDVGIQQHLDRRLRSLDPHFEVERARKGRETTYSLVGRRAKPLEAEGGVSKKLRAWVLRDQRCAQCGRTPSTDGVRLHVDHKIPRRWGGTSQPDNLQALCSECNEGKRDYYATYDKFAGEIKQAIGYDEPHRRIGELLKAFHREPVRGDLLERVASIKQYQEDWQKRLRELRTLGWKIEAERRKEKGRVLTSYRLVEDPPDWPPGSIRAAIREAERERGYRVRSASSTRWTAVLVSSCSQIRITVQPAATSRAPCSRSRSMLRAIFGLQ
jgi:5-methylcytosine-specific restriction endonuclease McrA